MSRLYFHTRARTAELHGSEYHHLRHIAERVGEQAWELNTTNAFERAAWIASLIPEQPDNGYGANYVHVALRNALAQEERNRAIYAATRPGDPLATGTTHEPQRKLVELLKLRLRAEGVTLNIAGVSLRSADLEANAALAAGSDPIRLAAKLAHWGPKHCWVEGPDRKWLADVIDEGLDVGLFRRGMWYVDGPIEGLAAEHPDRKWATQGWEDLLNLLREADDEPVVCSYSVNERFPNQFIAGWQPPELPADWVPSWASDEQGRAEWDALDEDNRRSQREDAATDMWYELPNDEQWNFALTGLGQARPWAQLSPDTLAAEWFSVPLSVYDLLAADRDERIRAAVPVNDVKAAERADS